MNCTWVFSFILFASFIWSTLHLTPTEDHTTSNLCNPICLVGEMCVLQNNQPTCISVCGDGIVTNNQACDDGDTDEENGCTNACQVSPYWVCIKQLEGNKYVSQCIYNPIEKCALYNVTADNKIQCQKCEVGQQVSADGQKCLLKMPGCLKLNQQRSNYKSSFCSQCQNRYQLSDNTDKCLYKIMGCVKFDQTKSTFMHTLCSQCQNGLMVSSDRQKCYLTIPTCSVHDLNKSNSTNSYCTICKLNYQISLLRDKCMPIIPGCLQYDQINSNSTKSHCLKCVDSGVLSDTKDKCIKKIEGCSFYEQFYSSFSQSTCASCSSQYKQQEDKNFYFVKIAGCSVYDLAKSNGLNSLCVQCKADLLLSYQKDKCMMLIQGCLTYNEANSTSLSSQCLLCPQILQISAKKDKCMLKIEGCSLYDEQNSNNSVSFCIGCPSPNQQPSSNKDKCILTIPGCIKYDQLISTNISSVCSSCGVLTSPINKDKCMFTLQQCQLYDEPHSSSSMSFCQTCRPGFQISKDTTKCMIIIMGCSKYDEQISNSRGSICQQCSSGSRVPTSGLKCMLLIPACSQYDEHKSNYQYSQCLTCSDVNHLLTDLRDKCIIKIDACKIHDQTLSSSTFSICTQCQQPNQVVTLNRSKCILANVQHCALYNQQISTYQYSNCGQCQTGYLVSQNSSLCYPQIKTCVQYNLALDTCLRCSPGFFLAHENKSCLSYSTLGCSNDSNGTCLPNPGFLLDGDMVSYVYKDVQGCFKYDKFGMCLQCLPGYNTIQNTNLSLPLSCSSPYAQFTRRQYYRSSGIKVIANWILNKNLSDTMYDSWKISIYANYDIYPIVLDSLYYKAWPDGENFCSFVFKRKYSCNYTYKFQYTKYQTCSCYCRYDSVETKNFLSCNKFLVLNRYDYRFCANTTSINGTTLCTQCEDGYQPYQGDIIKYCQPINDAYKFQAYTPLGIVRVLNITTPIHDGWRVLTYQQAKLVKNNLDKRIEQYETYMFNYGTHFYQNNSFILSNNISVNDSDYYIIKMAPGEILNCQFYSPGDSSLCFRCRDGYVLSNDRLNCNPPLVTDCYVYHPLLLYCVSTNQEITDFRKNKQLALLQQSLF